MTSSLVCSKPTESGADLGWQRKKKNKKQKDFLALPCLWMISSSELCFEGLCYSPDRENSPTKTLQGSMSAKTELVGLRGVTLKENTQNAEYLIYL